MKLKLSVKSLAVLSLIVGGLVSQSALANDNNPNHIMMQQQYGLDCSRRLDGCQGQGDGSSGDGYYREPKPKPVYHWVAVNDNTSPQSTNMPMFFSLKARFGAQTTAQRFLDYLTLYALDQCNKHYGTGTCYSMSSSFGDKNSYVATASTAKKGATKGFVALTRWAHDSKAQAEQRAIQACQATARQNNYNPSDCRVIDSRSFTNTGNWIDESTLRLYHKDPRLCQYFPNSPSCEK